MANTARRTSGPRTTRRFASGIFPEPGKFRALVTLYKASARLSEARALDQAALGTVARSHRRSLRPVDRRLRQSEGPPDHPAVAQQVRRDAAHRRHGHASPVAGLRPCGRAGHAHGESVRGHQGAVFRRSRRHHLDRCRHRPHQARSARRSRPRHRPRRPDRTAARRSVAAVLVACARQRDRHPDQQVRTAGRGAHPALCRFARRAGAHPEALDHDPDEPQGAAVDRRRLRHR